MKKKIASMFSYVILMYKKEYQVLTRAFSITKEKNLRNRRRKYKNNWLEYELKDVYNVYIKCLPKKTQILIVNLYCTIYLCTYIYYLYIFFYLFISFQMLGFILLSLFSSCILFVAIVMLSFSYHQSIYMSFVFLFCFVFTFYFVI